MNQKSHKLSALAFACVPLTFAIFAAYYYQAQWTLRHIVDLAIFAGGYCCLNMLALSAKNRWLRAILSLGLCVLIVIFHFANMMFLRFFCEPMPYDIFAEIRAAPAVTDAVFQLFGWPDAVLGIVLPLALAGLALRLRPEAGLRKSAMFAGLTASMIAVSVALSYTQMPAGYEPVVGVARQAIQTQTSLTASRLNDLAGRREELFPIESDRYRYAESARGLLLKTPVTDAGFSTQTNVVIIVMESFRAYECGAYGSVPSYTPRFDELAKDALVFDPIYANSCQTVRGEFATIYSQLPSLSGAPDFEVSPEVQLKALPSILKENGYHTSWICAYHREFQGMGAFHLAHGFDHLHDAKTMPSEPIYGMGLSDDAMFEIALKTIGEQREPFFTEILTLSNHFPFANYPTASQTPTAPGPLIYQNYTRGIYFGDYALGRFFDAARKQSWFKNTIFAIVADHGLFLYPRTPKLSRAQQYEAAFRIPFMIYAPGIVKPGRVQMLGSQIDVAPTLLDVLGIRAPNTMAGRSLLNERVGFDQRYAFMISHNRWLLRSNNSYFYCCDPNETEPEKIFDDNFIRYRFLGGQHDAIGFTSSFDLLRAHPGDSRMLPDGECRRIKMWGLDAINMSMLALRLNRVCCENAEK